MLALVTAHFFAAAIAPALFRAFGRRSFLVLAIVPAVAFGWAMTQAGRISSGEPLLEAVQWVPSFGFELAFRMDTLQWVMMLIVTGVGALVLGYCAWYFEDGEDGLPGFAGFFVAFAGAMLGLVLSEDLLLLYVFWELTTVFSYLLIGYDPDKRANRTAATQALIVTTLGGLAMLVGILMIGVEAGTYQVSQLLADPPQGTSITIAVILLVIGAISKSAMFPFHFWLPAAMAAPTPVSAYLHAAAMVKAGVYLAALLAPAFANVPGWRSILLTLGVLTMLLGGWRALRQLDLKLVLAFGTVSQLGFLLVIVSTGSRAAALAGIAMLLAHALFKASLFLVIGVVDHSTGTRDLRELSGVGKAMPGLTIAAVLAGASMAGLPPMIGFVAKESVFESLLDVAKYDGDGTGISALAGWAIVVGVVLGSALTTAYTARFLWGTFASKPGLDPTEVHTPPVAFQAAPVVLATLSLLLGFAGTALTDLIGTYSEQFAPGEHETKLALWHGINLALGLSLISLISGLALFWFRDPFGALQSRISRPYSAEGGYRQSLRALDRAAVEVTGMTQRGSLGIYLSVILAVVILLPGSMLLRYAGWPGDTVLWDTPAQALVGGVIIVAALLTARSRRRITAVVMVGITGYGLAVLFLVHGSPDLALTQLLVETVTLVVVVLVMRRLPAHFTDRPLSFRRYARMAIAALVGTAVAGFMVMASNARTAVPVSVRFPEAAVEYGGGKNVVNVILVDIRAWDTLGEIAVLVVAATGVASLIFLETRSTTIQRASEVPESSLGEQETVAGGKRTWLSGGRTQAPETRSIIFEVTTRLMFHTIVVFSMYLLFAGHNNPGGGFAAGLVTGLALMIRYLAGGKVELDEALPVDAGRVVGGGLALATATGLAPLAFGGTVLQSAIVDLHVPVLGDVHLVTSLFFDIGVYLIVVGLMLDLLRSLGGGIDRHVADEEQADEVPAGVGAAT